MNEMKVFENTEFGNLTVIEKEGEPFFVAKEIADILGYSKTNRMVNRLDDDEKTYGPVLVPTSNYEVNHVLINESGFYNAVLGSKKPIAKELKKWVTGTVLPQIRRDGMYISKYATDEQKKFNYNLLEQTFKNTPLEELKNTYRECMEFHKINKTRLEYTRSSPTRRKDKLKTVADSKIAIMEKIKDAVEERVMTLDQFGFREPLVHLAGEICVDIKTVNHNRTKGRLARKTYELESLR